MHACARVSFYINHYEIIYFLLRSLPTANDTTNYHFTTPNNSCRVIQKAIPIRCLDQDDVSRLVNLFRDQVMNFIYDPNGNHVIQQSIQVMSRWAKSSLATDDGHNEPDQSSTCLSDQMQFIIDEIIDNVQMLSTHRYGCRVVQRAIQHCVDSQKLAVLEEIISCHEKLIMDQYGKMLLRFILSPRF